MSKNLRLFEGHGIEIEYMIVDRKNLDVRPISDELIRSFAGVLASDFEDGEITWSNELVLHVIELKTSGPASSLADLEMPFHRSVLRINDRLESLGAMLMPTAMHPWMDPISETRLWPHDNNEIYAAYNRIFGCQGHGWSNLQSMHINLPFADDAEFVKLHSAIRCLLPLLPALSSSSPVCDGRVTEWRDNRLRYYQQNQKSVPSIAGDLIPEPVRSIDEYRTSILGRIFHDIAPHDPDQFLREDWLNSRGAIPRFGRQTIEIRVLDVQECPKADLAIADFIVSCLKQWVSGLPISVEDQLRLPTERLKRVFDKIIENGELSLIDDPIYLEAIGLGPKPVTAQEIWRYLFETPSISRAMTERHRSTMSWILENGSLASRILRAVGPSADRARLRYVYSNLCACLQSNDLFDPGPP